VVRKLVKNFVSYSIFIGVSALKKQLIYFQAKHTIIVKMDTIKNTLKSTTGKDQKSQFEQGKQS